MNTKFNNLSAFIVTSVLASGCAGGVSVAVKEQDKDPSNSYDGIYMATVDHPGGRQNMGNNWFNTCGAQDFASPISVKGSEVTWQWDEDTPIKGFVDTNGRFRINHPLGDVARATNTVLSNNSVTVVLQGVLNEDSMEGRLVFAMGQFNGRGCTYPVSYQASN